MFEKVNPTHPDKVADRIAGAIVDQAYRLSSNPHIAVEVLLGHGNCHIITESDVDIPFEIIESIVARIAGDVNVDYQFVPQDIHLNANQCYEEPRCGDNGIFKGMPVSQEEKDLTEIAKFLYSKYGTDGKYLIGADGRLTICQSYAREELVGEFKDPDVIINPLGYWTGGPTVDCGATNRKIGSDMGRGATGGGLHGKDLSKADVSVNIYAHLKAQETGYPVELSCSIGDRTVDGKSYSEIVRIAQAYIYGVGGFEKFAEWGLIR